MGSNCARTIDDEGRGAGLQRGDLNNSRNAHSSEFENMIKGEGAWYLEVDTKLTRILKAKITVGQAKHKECGLNRGYFAAQFQKVSRC